MAVQVCMMYAQRRSSCCEDACYHKMVVENGEEMEIILSAGQFLCQLYMVIFPTKLGVAY